MPTANHNHPGREKRYVKGRLNFTNQCGIPDSPPSRPTRPGFCPGYLNTNYWTNDVIDPDQKTGFVLNGSDPDVLSYYTRYNNPKVNDLVAAARVETDAAKRKGMYFDLQRIAQEEVNWLGLYYSPFRNASRSNVKDFFQNPMGRFMLETTSIE